MYTRYPYVYNHGYIKYSCITRTHQTRPPEMCCSPHLAVTPLGLAYALWNPALSNLVLPRNLLMGGILVGCLAQTAVLFSQSTELNRSILPPKLWRTDVVVSSLSANMRDCVGYFQTILVVTPDTCRIIFI